MKKWLQLFAVSCMMIIILTSTALAAGWTNGQGENQSRWWYDLGSGQYYGAETSVPEWQWLDGNGDGVAECYAFDQQGWMYADTVTPDGYRVNADGAWTDNNTVQTRAMVPGYAGTGRQQGQTQDSGDKRILIAYFSHTGTTEEAARQIQKAAGGDLFEIRTVNQYPDSYQNTVDIAQNELNRNARPALSSTLENMADYDVILVGYPIWWHTAPMAVDSFLETYDLSGKTILPFCTSAGSDISESMAAIRAASGNGTVGTGLTANSLSETTIRAWLNANGV